MSLLTSPTFYRFSQICAVMIFPTALSVLFLIRVQDRVVVPGIVETDRQVILTSPLEKAIVKEIKVESGDNVEKGQILIEFSDLPGFRHALAKARASIFHLERQIGQLKPLYERKLVQGEKLWDLEAELDKVKVEADELAEKCERLQVKAPDAGKIINVFVKPYELADVGRQLVSIAVESGKLIRCRVPEKRVETVHPGEKVTIKSEFYNFIKHNVYHGVVTEVSPFGIQENGGIYYETLLRITAGNEQLRVGSAVQCEIIVDEVRFIELFFEQR